MNTLNFKALLIKYGLLIFLRAVAFYLLLSFPAMMALPTMYLISASYALSFGWIAAVVFWLALYTLQFLPLRRVTKAAVLYMVVAAAVVLAFQCLELAGVQEQIWQSGPFLLFPAAAVVSGWISLFLSRHTLQKLFTESAKTEPGTAVEGTPLHTENIFN
jgi:hypothetical protein